QGNDVAFITIGDPFLYSTFLYLHRIFREKYPDIPLEVVPGISSINAAAVAAGIPLGMASERIAVIPAAFEQENLRKTLDEFDTVVLMKMSRVFDGIYELLWDMGLERNAVYVSRVGAPDQKVVFDLETLVGQKLDYLSLLIVKK
ncbi:MAG TPA: precorrin-2 C(20)-methyltransferase, partial [Geobacteraceae bacterium]|nr:precorrin-2 C(20)-methyltransferase [Geobacteraceae bacterium]